MGCFTGGRRLVTSAFPTASPRRTPRSGSSRSTTASSCPARSSTKSAHARARAAINNLCKRARARTTASNLLVLCLTRFNILQKRKHFPKKKKNLFPPKKKKKKKKKK